MILQHALEVIRQKKSDDHSLIEETAHVRDAVNRLGLSKLSGPERFERRWETHRWVKHRLWELYQHSPGARECAEDTLRFINGIPGDAKSFEPLGKLLDAQSYRLAYWKMAAEEINY